MVGLVQARTKARMGRTSTARRLEV